MGKASEKLPAQVVSLDGTALHLLVDAPMEVGAAVKAQCDDALLLGEVCHCQPSDRQYALGVRLEHALVHTAELARLAQRLLEDVPCAAPPPHATPPHPPGRR